MKKGSLYFTALSMILCFVYSSCKKSTSHSTNPTPGNTRLLSYTKTSSANILLPLPQFVPTVLESYTFTYDNSGRVSKIIYSSSDTTKFSSGLANLIMTFTYSGNNIYKTTSRVNNTVVEVDSFVQAGGLITNIYTPTLDYVYQYNNSLLFNGTETAHDSLSQISASWSITSSGGNFLKLTYDGSLSAKFTALTPPIKVFWSFYRYTAAGIDTTKVTQSSNTSSTVLSNYDREPAVVMACDTIHDTAYGFFPGGIWLTQDYTFWGDNNRIGDYLQLQSFTNYGLNIYQNAKLVKTITNSGYTTNVNYVIDAQSKITQTNVSMTDSLTNTYSQVYKLQYTTY